MNPLHQIFEKVTVPEGCWEWQGAKSSFGHGRVKQGGRLLLPHRVVFEAFNGSLAEGELVLHHCDNPACVNPRHLFKGSHSDNMKDCAAKGRLGSQTHPEPHQGVNHSGAKLTDEAVREIRRSAGIVPIKQMARQFGVHKSIIQKVIKRQRWAHVSDEVWL